MSQYNSLFDKSEIEYITPFLKLWMAFNNWYKSDLFDIKRDRDAISQYKQSGRLKDEYLNMLGSRAAKYKSFQEELANFVSNSKEDHGISGLDWNRQGEYLHRNPSKKDKKDNSLEHIADTNTEYFISPEYKDDFFSDTLENIYLVRCTLVHGDFDINNLHFVEIVKNVYGIFYPVMQAVLEVQHDSNLYCISRKGTDAKGLFLNGKITVLRGSKICAETVNSYEKSSERLDLLNKNAKLEENVYEIENNIEFPSVSAASSFCLGNSSNGWLDWKDAEGQTLNDIVRRQK